MIVDVYYTGGANRSPAAPVQGQQRPTFSGTNTFGPGPATTASHRSPGGLTAWPQPASRDEVTLKGNLASDSSLHNKESSDDVGPGAGEETGVSLFALHARGS